MFRPFQGGGAGSKNPYLDKTLVFGVLAEVDAGMQQTGMFRLCSFATGDGHPTMSSRRRRAVSRRPSGRTQSDNGRPARDRKPPTAALSYFAGQSMAPAGLHRRTDSTVYRAVRQSQAAAVRVPTRRRI